MRGWFVGRGVCSALLPGLVGTSLKRHILVVAGVPQKGKSMKVVISIAIEILRRRVRKLKSPS